MEASEGSTVAEPAIVHDEPYEVEQRLAELGLRSETLIDVLRQGELQRRMASPLDPPSAPGVAAWARSVRALREQLIPSGWTPSDRFNFSTVVSPDGALAIAVATGDDGTGDSSPEVNPRTKYRRGPTYARALARNVQLELFPETNVPSDPTNESTVTWILLRRSTSDAIYAELSRPLRLGEDERVSEWAERIILGPINLDGDVEVSEVPDEPLPDSVVYVQRKSS
jgi:hypothetical protein